MKTHRVAVVDGLGFVCVMLLFMTIGTCSTASSVKDLADDGVICRVEIQGG